MSHIFMHKQFEMQFLKHIEILQMYFIMLNEYLNIWLWKFPSFQFNM